MTKVSDFIRKAKNTTCSVVVVAAGSSVRMGEDKLYMDLCGKPVLAHTLLALNGCPFVNEIILVVRPDNLEKASQLCVDYSIDKAGKVVCGGKNRTESALAGLSEISRNAKIVLIHDGARPLVTEDVIYDAMHTAAIYKCAAPAVPVADTVKVTEDGVVVRTLERDKLSAIQTPQAFMPEIIKASLSAAVRDHKEYTDDCAAVEAMGFKVRLSRGSPENIKITRPTDIQTATAILAARKD